VGPADGNPYERPLEGVRDVVCVAEVTLPPVQLA
jgi:hypothetical protein